MLSSVAEVSTNRLDMLDVSNIHTPLQLGKQYKLTCVNGTFPLMPVLEAPETASELLKARDLIINCTTAIVLVLQTFLGRNKDKSPWYKVKVLFLDDIKVDKVAYLNSKLLLGKVLYQLWK